MIIDGLTITGKRSEIKLKSDIFIFYFLVFRGQCGGWLLFCQMVCFAAFWAFYVGLFEVWGDLEL